MAGEATPDLKAAAEAAKTGEAAVATGAAGAGAAAAAGAETGKTVTLSQDELDIIVQNRTAQARRVANEAADKAKKWDEYEAGQKTDAEKAAAKLADAERVAKERIALADARLAASEIRLQATAKGVRPEALSLVAKLLADAEGIAVDETGKVTGVEAALAKLLADNPYLLPEKGTAGKGGSQMTGEAAKTAAEKIAAAELAKDPRLSIGLKMAGLLGGQG